MLKKKEEPFNKDKAPNFKWERWSGHVLGSIFSFLAGTLSKGVSYDRWHPVFNALHSVITERGKNASQFKARWHTMALTELHTPSICTACTIDQFCEENEIFKILSPLWCAWTFEEWNNVPDASTQWPLRASISLHWLMQASHPFGSRAGEVRGSEIKANS